MEPQIRQEARYIADLIDNGQVRQAANIMRQDLCELDGRSARDLISATRAYEQPGGSELVLHHARDRYGRSSDQLVVGIATRCRDEYGYSSWDVIDIATVNSRARQNYRYDDDCDDGYRTVSGNGDWRRRQYSDSGWVQQNDLDPRGDYLNAPGSGSFFRPRQRIWSDANGYWDPDGVPYNPQQSFGRPGSRYAYANSSSPWNYSTVGDDWGSQRGGDWQDQRYRRSAYYDRFNNYDRFNSYDRFAGSNYMNDYMYDRGGDTGRYMAAYMAMSALGALSLRLRG